MTTMVKRALERMINPRPLDDTQLMRHMTQQREEIIALRARIAELERERDGLLDLIL